MRRLQNTIDETSARELKTIRGSHSNNLVYIFFFFHFSAQAYSIDLVCLLALCVCTKAKDIVFRLIIEYSSLMAPR
jgi:hypothetical protein